MKPSSTSLGFATPNYMPLSAFQFNKPSDLVTVNLIRKPSGFGFRLLGGSEVNGTLRFHLNILFLFVILCDEIVEIDGRNVEGVSHAEAVSLLEHAAHNKHVKLVVRRPRMGGDRRQSFHMERQPANAMSASGEYDVTLSRKDTDGFGFIIISSLNRNGSTIGGDRRQSFHMERQPANAMSASGEYDVTLTRNDTGGFGFIIISSLNRNGSTIAAIKCLWKTGSIFPEPLFIWQDKSGIFFSISGQILENSPAEKCGRLKVGDRVVAVNGIDILNLTHGEIVGLIKASGLSVRLTIAPPLPEGSPLASSTLNRSSVINMSYAPSPPNSFVPPPPIFQNGGLYATVGRGSNYTAYPQSSTTPAPFSYTNGSVFKGITSQYSPYADVGRPIYSSSHINGQLNGMSLNDPVPPEQVRVH
ncbi:unnamed protein product [Strongylus vulgaris]|uniref:PDZ domain-containing protein n=1 Tax=Strongylus vulgaris TaxID=40348 RepID=A0A3P7LFY4_STRVU|nr:unnamed protein product [Strongylus vulgaris]